MLTDFIFQKEMPSQTTETVMEIAPNKTKIGGAPKYTSSKIPIGINKPIKASHEIVFA